MFIGVAGIIAAGKSTLTTSLADLLEYEKYMEPVETNPYLTDFYADMARWGGIMQLHLLHARYGAHKNILSRSEGAVQDRTIYEDQIFANLLHKAGFLSDREMATYQMSLINLTCDLTPPDVIVYLRVNPEIALHRIRDKRRRKAEQGITLEYLSGLNEGYEEFIRDIAGKTRVIELAWNDYGSAQEVVDRILNGYK